MVPYFCWSTINLYQFVKSSLTGVYRLKKHTYTQAKKKKCLLPFSLSLEASVLDCRLPFNFHFMMEFPGGSEVKASACNTGDLGSIPGSGRSPREGNGNPFQYSCLENPMDGGAWWGTIHGVAKSQTRLTDFTFTFKKSCDLQIVHHVAVRIGSMTCSA